MSQVEMDLRQEIVGLHQQLGHGDYQIKEQHAVLLETQEKLSHSLIRELDLIAALDEQKELVSHYREQNENLKKFQLQLENRIRQQRHTLASMQASLRERNVVKQAWFEGREALLSEQLRQATSSLHNWREEAGSQRLFAEIAQRRLDELEQSPTLDV